MEIIINLLKQLATTLSPAEFLLAVSIIIVTTLSGLKFVLGLLNKGKGGILGLLTGNVGEVEGPSKTESALKDISSKIDIFSVNNKEQIGALATALHEHRTITTHHMAQIEKEISHIADRSQLIISLRQDIERMLDQINSDLEDLKDSIKDNEKNADKNTSMFREYVQRIQDHLNKLSSQFEKMEEFVRSSTPEFRSYHKDLSNELKTLSKELALIERTVQTQLNTGPAVKLR